MIASILNSIKKLLGIEFEDTSFDGDLITHINSIFSILFQLGVGPTTPFTIDNKDALWSSFIQSEVGIEMVKSYMYLRVKALFDPPSTSFTQDANKALFQEMEWRIVQMVEENDLPTPP